jgi:hypothetical protein
MLDSVQALLYVEKNLFDCVFATTRRRRGQSAFGNGESVDANPGILVVGKNAIR